jgi:RNA polymerase sigma-70 factor, ECF subfamily
MLNQPQIESLWNEYYPKVFGYFFKRIENYEDCQDLASKTMTVFLDKIDANQLSPDVYYGYLWKVARTNLINHINARKTRNQVFSVENEEFFEQIEDEKVKSQQYENLVLSVFDQARNILTSDELFLLNLSYQQGKNSQQIALELESSSSAIRKRLSRTIQKLKTNLKPK